MRLLSYTDSEAFLTSRSRQAQLNAKRLPSLGLNAPPYSSAATANLVGGVVVSSGIYQIENQVNGKRYVGGSVNLQRRQGIHLRQLRQGQHSNLHLQRAFDMYGEEAFVFSVLEETKPEALIGREQHYLDTLNPEYNIFLTAGSPRGYHHSLETRKKMSKNTKGNQNSFYGKHHSPKTIRKMSEIKRAKHPSAETRKKISTAMKGKALSIEHRRKIGEAHKGKIHSQEWRRKNSEAHKGKHPTEDSRQKMSIAQRTRRAREKREREEQK